METLTRIQQHFRYFALFLAVGWEQGQWRRQRRRSEQRRRSNRRRRNGNEPSLHFSRTSGLAVGLYGQLKVVGTKLEDHAGNPVQLKGVSSYWLNWESTKYAESKSALQYMRDNWKLTALRARWARTHPPAT